MSDRQRVALVLGVVAAVVALVVAATPVSADGLDCGSVLGRRGDSLACDSRLGVREQVAWFLGVAGVVAILGAVTNRGDGSGEG